MLEVEKLTKLYDKKHGITNIDFSIEKGEIYGFIGPNGAGKSTTIRTILNLLRANSGTSTLDGLDTSKHTSKVLQIVGYVPSELHYYENMTGLRLLKYSERFYKKKCNRRREELADLLDLDLNKKISDYSSGNKKKLGIIDALQHQPKFLILDEPTSGLDPLIQNKFFKLLKQEQKRGTTIFFSSHILNEVERICDRVAVIKEGQIIAVEDMKQMRISKVKRVRISASEQIVIDGGNEVISNLQSDDKFITFLYNGEINQLILLLSAYNLEDVQITEPTLEEIFIHYYE